MRVIRPKKTTTPDDQKRHIVEIYKPNFKKLKAIEVKTRIKPTTIINHLLANMNQTAILDDIKAGGVKGKRAGRPKE